jgi:hypothetical protein
MGRGQLTTRGFMQHIELGKQLSSLYGTFLRGVSTDRMYVRSTNYARTVQVITRPQPCLFSCSASRLVRLPCVQSVSALLIALLPHLHNEKRRVPILYFPNEEDEIMHGLGVRQSSHTNASAASAHAEIVYSGGCAASVKLAAQQEKVTPFSHNKRTSPCSYFAMCGI